MQQEAMLPNVITDSALISLPVDARGGRFRVSHEVTFTEGTGTQTDAFFFRNDT